MQFSSTLKMIQSVKADKFGRKDPAEMYPGAKACVQKKHTRQMRAQGKSAVRQGLMDIDLEKVLLEIEAKEKVEAGYAEIISEAADLLDRAREVFYEFKRLARLKLDELPVERRDEAYGQLWFPTLD